MGALDCERAPSSLARRQAVAAHECDYDGLVPRRDPHAILGVPAGASPATIKAAWRRLARAHHPDLATDADAQAAATRRMAQINAAYAELTGGTAGRSAARAGRAAGGDTGRAGRADPEERADGGAGPDTTSAARAGPPPPPPTRPVTARLDTSELLHPRNATTTDRRAGYRTHPPGQAPRRARSGAAEPPRASDPTGPLERRRRGRRRVDPSLDAALATEVPFGKFHGATLGEIAATEPSYVDWIARTITRDPDLVAAARVVVADLDRSGVSRPVRAGARPGSAD